MCFLNLLSSVIGGDAEVEKLVAPIFSDIPCAGGVPSETELGSVVISLSEDVWTGVFVYGPLFDADAADGTCDEKIVTVVPVFSVEPL